jgi:zona occludens toxin (predicted ATPase)
MTMKASLAFLLASLLLAGCTSDVRDQYEVAFTKDQRIKQQQADAADDAQCRREGAQPASDFYNLCRTRLADRRTAAEAEADARAQGGR